jgi:hypothetical protein
MRRKKPEPAPPPPPEAIVLDGSNVTASAVSGAPARLAAALSWCSDFAPRLPIAVWFDASTLRRLGAEVERRLADAAAPHGAEVRVAAPGTAADAAILAEARSRRALLVSNDRYWDHEDLRRDVLLLQFVCTGGSFRAYQEATWFLPSGAARRVALTLLRP